MLIDFRGDGRVVFFLCCLNVYYIYISLLFHFFLKLTPLMYRFQLVVHPGPSDVPPVRKGDPSVSEEAGLAPTHLDAAGVDPTCEDVESYFDALFLYASIFGFPLFLMCR